MPKKKIRKFVAKGEQEIESDLKNPNHDGKDHENKLGAQIEIATNKEKRALSPNLEEEGAVEAKETETDGSNPEERESEGMKELETEQKKENEKKNEEPKKTNDGSNSEERESEGMKELETEEEKKITRKMK